MSNSRKDKFLTEATFSPFLRVGSGVHMSVDT